MSIARLLYSGAPQGRRERRLTANGNDVLAESESDA